MQSHARRRDREIQTESGRPFIIMTEKYGEYQKLPTRLVSSKDYPEKFHLVARLVAGIQIIFLLSKVSQLLSRSS